MPSFLSYGPPYPVWITSLSSFDSWRGVDTKDDSGTRPPGKSRYPWQNCQDGWAGWSCEIRLIIQLVTALIWRNVILCWHFRHIFTVLQVDEMVLHIPYNVCWWSGDPMRHGIGSNTIAQKYSAPYINKFSHWINILNWFVPVTPYGDKIR